MRENSPYWGAPENLAQVYTIVNPNANYDFATVVIVSDTNDNKVYAAYDSGCSCPSPFEEHVFPTDFTELKDSGDLEKFIDGAVPDYIHYDSSDLALAQIAVELALKA